MHFLQISCSKKMATTYFPFFTLKPFDSWKLDISVVYGCRIIFPKEFNKWRCLILKIILNALSRSLSIRLLNFLIWNILTNGQQPNSEAIKAFIVILRLRMLMNCEILGKTYNFLLTRLQIFVTWVSKSSLLFKFIPNSLLSLLFLITSLSILKGILSLLFLITSLSISHDQREDRHSLLKRTSSPTFSKSAIEFDELILIKRKKESLFLNKPVHIRFSVLLLSKNILLLLHLHA